jgi:hypothetical protein
MEHNKNYQLFLQRLNHVLSSPPSPEPSEEDARKGDNFGTNDLQLAEATNILKDMIYLQSKIRQKEYMVGAEN